MRSYSGHLLYQQFLKSIYSVDKNIDRIGGDSKFQSMLKPRLNVLSEKLHDRDSELMCTNVQEQINRCTTCLRATQISRGLRLGIASEQHIESLYSKDSLNDQRIEDVWLKGAGDELVVDKDDGKCKGKQKVSNKSSSAEISLDNILSFQDLWLLPPKIKDQAA